MAAAANSLSIEFECVVCSDQLKQPKCIGPCNHTFCKDCINKYWVSLGNRRTIPCPQCREECPIPSNGADDLKDNFILTNIIETYLKQQQTNVNLAGVRCTLCPNGASCFCKECDLKLCPECKRQHDQAPENRNHDIFGLCPSHGNGLLFFCNSCKRAVCGGCKVSDHDKGKHDVTPICPVVGNLTSRIQACSAELEDAIRTQVGEQEKQLSRLRDIVQQKSTSAEEQATASAERTIAAQRKEIGGLKAESLRIQNQINALVKKKEKVDERTKQLVEDADKRDKEKAKIIADVRGRFTKSSEEIDQRLRSLDTRRKEMVAKIQQGRAVGSTKIAIDTESIANLASIRQELVDLVKDSRESGTVIEEVGRSIRELGLGIGDIVTGLSVVSGDQHIRIVKTKRVFRQLKKVCNVEAKCKTIYRLKHVHVPDSRLATLGCRTEALANMIHIHDMVSSALTGAIESGVHPANDMAVSSTGELVLARYQTPPIRVFNPATGACRDIKITHDGNVISMLCCVETDGSDNMFVLTGFCDPLLLVVKPNGNVIHSVQLRGLASYMAFCPLSRILYIAADDRIRRFHWTNNILQEISPSAHGVDGFRFGYVCIGSGGEVLVVGWMRNNDIVIYQVSEGKDEKDLVWRKIEYQDGAKRNSGRYMPHICINDDNLWLGYKHIIEKFQLV